MKLRMPAEWEKHERTWMSWPPNNYLLGENDKEAELTRTTWANVANAIVKYEPVTVLATSDQIELARNYLHTSIEMMPGLEIMVQLLPNQRPVSSSPSIGSSMVGVISLGQALIKIS